MAGLRAVVEELKKRRDRTFASEKKFRTDMVDIAIGIERNHGFGAQTQFIEETAGTLAELSHRTVAKAEAYGEAIALLEGELKRRRKRR